MSFATPFSAETTSTTLRISLLMSPARAANRRSATPCQLHHCGTSLALSISEIAKRCSMPCSSTMTTPSRYPPSVPVSRRRPADWLRSVTFSPVPAKRTKSRSTNSGRSAPRGRDLQVVPAGHGVRHVQQTGHAMAHPCAVVHRHSLFAIYVDPDQGARIHVAPQHAHQLEPQRKHRGLDQLVQLPLSFAHPQKNPSKGVSRFGPGWSLGCW